jgi:hypothetical protein
VIKGERAEIAPIAPPPCDTCPMQRRCKVERLACYDFLKYAHCVPQAWGRPPRDRRIATRDFYITAFGPSEEVA